jgi:hypothetical protein
MIYKVFSDIDFDGTHTSDTQSISTLDEALDLYRQVFTTMAETIVDCGGSLVTMLYSIDDNDKMLIIKRNTLDTTVNILSDVQHQ